MHKLRFNAKKLKGPKSVSFKKNSDIWIGNFILSPQQQKGHESTVKRQNIHIKGKGCAIVGTGKNPKFYQHTQNAFTFMNIVDKIIGEKLKW